MSDDDETPPDPLAEFDQMLRAAVDVAKLIRAYFGALVGEGFSEQQALQLVIAYQQSILGAK